MGDEFRREIAAASLPSTRVTNVTKSDCGIALVKKGRKAKVVSGPQIGWKGQGRKSTDVEMGCLHFLPKYSTSRLAVNGDWYGTRAKVRKLLRPLARAAARGTSLMLDARGVDVARIANGMLLGWWEWRYEGSHDDALEFYRALAQYGLVPVEDYISRSDWEEWAASECADVDERESMRKERLRAKAKRLREHARDRRRLRRKRMKVRPIIRLWRRALRAALGEAGRYGIGGMRFASGRRRARVVELAGSKRGRPWEDRAEWMGDWLDDGAAADMLGGPGGLWAGASMGADGGAGVVGFGVSGAGEAGVDTDGDGGFGEGTRGSDAGDGSAEPAGAAADRTGGPGKFAGTACFVKRMAAQAVYAGRAVRAAQTGIVGWARGLGEAMRTIGSLILLGSLAALAGRSGAGVAAQAVHGRLVMRVARQPATMRGGRMRGCCGKVASGKRGLNVEEQEPAAAVVGRWRDMDRSAGGGRAIGLRRGPHAGWVQGSARLRRPCGDRAITHCCVFRCRHR